MRFHKITEPDETPWYTASDIWVLPLNSFHIEELDTAGPRGQYWRGMRYEPGEKYLVVVTAHALELIFFPKGSQLRILYPDKADCGFWIGHASSLNEAARVDQTFWPIRFYTFDKKPTGIKWWLIKTYAAIRAIFSPTATNCPF